MGSLEADARQLLDGVEADPVRLVDEAIALAAEAGRVGDGAAASVAERATGVGLLIVGEPQRSLHHLDASVRLARRHRRRDLVSEAQMSRAATLTYLGSTTDALRAANFACRDLDGLELARARAQRGSILNRLGRPDEALADLDVAIPVLRRRGDVGWELVALNNRALLLAWNGTVAAAARDLERARDLAKSLGHTARMAEATHNLGFVATRAGDFPKALGYFDAAEELLQELGYPLVITWPDRAEALLGAGLVSEARPLLEETARRLEADGMEADAAETTLLLAHAQLLEGDAEASLQAARLAGSVFRQQRRPGWLAQAKAVELRSAWRLGRRLRDVGGRAAELAIELDQAGQAVPAALVRSIGLEGTKDPRSARGSQLGAAVRRAARSGPLEVRTRAWLALARSRLAVGDRRGAGSAARAGLAVVDAQRAALGALDARVGVGRHAAELADLGLDLATESGDTSRIFGAVEQARAASLLHPPARPPEDTRLGEELAQLRGVSAELRGANAADPRTRRLWREAARLQRSVTSRSRQAPGTARRAERTELSEVVQALGERRLIELFEHRDRLWAIDVAGSRAELRDAGDASVMFQAADTLRFALFRLAPGDVSPRREAAALTAAEVALAQLDVLAAGAVGPTVIVPPPRLFAVPWPALPTLRECPITVAPSASLWLRAHTRRSRRRRVVVAGGPDLEHAAREVRSISALHPGAVRYTPRQAKSAAVAAALDGASLGHLACHGAYRADNPLFSSLRFADGPLFVHDLQRLKRAPDKLVLSACESGASAAPPGNEIMGLASTVLAMGTRSLVASAGPVPDSSLTRGFMVDLHRLLAADADISSALHGAASKRSRSPRDDLLVRSFVCLGHE